LERNPTLGLAVKEGSETTDDNESGDRWALADVALTLLAERAERPVFAVDALLTRHQLVAIDAGDAYKACQIGESWWARQGSNL